MPQLGSFPRAVNYKWRDNEVELFRGRTAEGAALRIQSKVFFKVAKRRKLSNMADLFFVFFVSVMDVTRGQRGINLHVISGAVIEWMHK